MADLKTAHWAGFLLVGVILVVHIILLDMFLQVIGVLTSYLSFSHVEAETLASLVDRMVRVGLCTACGHNSGPYSYCLIYLLKLT